MPKTDLQVERKSEMLDRIINLVVNNEVQAKPIRDLVLHFRKLLEVEKQLPPDTKLCLIHEVANTHKVRDGSELKPEHHQAIADRAGIIVEALRYAVEGVTEQDSLEKKEAYQDAANVLTGYHSLKIEQAVALYKIMGATIQYAPHSFIADGNLFQAFLKEVPETDDLHDKDTLLRNILTFARNTNNKDLAIDAVELDSDMGKKFILDNFDWLCEDPSEKFIQLIKYIINKIGEETSDTSKADRLLEILARNNAMEGILIDWNYDLICNNPFGKYASKWAVLHLSLVKSFSLYWLSLVAEDTDFTRIVDELTSRKDWSLIVLIRKNRSGQQLRHYAQQALDAHVNDIPVDPDNSDSYKEDSAIHTIAFIGLDEGARLRAVERIKEAGISSSSGDYIFASIALNSVVKGFANYSNPVVQAAAQKAHDEIKSQIVKLAMPK